MEKKMMNFVKDGAIKLPPGFRFQPTDEEIVFEYLTRKISSWPMPSASVIPHIYDNICKYDPWNLPGTYVFLYILLRISYILLYFLNYFPYVFLIRLCVCVRVCICFCRRFGAGEILLWEEGSQVPEWK